MLRTSEFILNFVLNSCWQVAAVFAVATLGSRLLKNGPARYRHTLWVAALAACLIVPLLTATRFIPVWISSVQVVTRQENVAPVSNPRVSQTDLAVDQIDHIGSPRRKTLTTTTRTVLLLTLAYSLFIFGRGVRLVRFWQRKERLRRSASLAGLSPDIEAVASRCSRLLGIANASVRRSDEARVPYTLGARRPLIVLPDAFCSTSDEARLLSVIGHEMAHVARRDFLTNLVCELVALPISFHPLTFLIKRQIDRAR